MVGALRSRRRRHAVGEEALDRAGRSGDLHAEFAVLGVVRSSPFRGKGSLPKLAPFALAAVLAQASLLLPPGYSSGPAAAASLSLLVAAGAAIGLVPWARLSTRATVVVPLVYCASALMLTLAAGPNSGIGVVVLIPLVWTALFHDRWQAAVVVGAIVLVELYASVAQHALDATLVRRLVLWGLLGAAVSTAIHGVRDRVRDSYAKATRLRDQLREAEWTEERLRIALNLQERLGHRVFATTLTLAKAAQFDTDRRTHDLIVGAVAELDEALLLLRNGAFERRDGGTAIGGGVPLDGGGLAAVGPGGQ
ncbi:MAG: hypothetical protein KGJ77_01360 [Acidobacteriota bacterium]|nr:hypothetical protein [Acidobacteriota bacterium]